VTLCEILSWRGSQPLPGGDVETRLLAPTDDLGRAESLRRLANEVQHGLGSPSAMCAARCAAQLGGMRAFARLNDRNIVVTRSLTIDIAVKVPYQADRWRLPFGT